MTSTLEFVTHSRSRSDANLIATCNFATAMLVSKQIVQATRVETHLEVGIRFYPIEQSVM